MRARHSHALTAGLTLCTALLIAGCAGQDAEEAPSESKDAEASNSGEAAELAEEGGRMQAGLAAELPQVPDLDFAELQGTDDKLMASLDQTITVTQTYQTDSVPVELAEQLVAQDPSVETEKGLFERSDDTGEVSAAEGETFVFAVIESSEPRWEPAGSSPNTEEPTTTAVRVAGQEVPDLEVDLSAGDQTTVVLSVPEGLGPDDVVLETLSAGNTQQVSLLDGVRTSSEAEHMYEGPTEVRVGEGASWSIEQEHESRYGVVSHTGELKEGVTSPMVPHLGWAEPGKVLLGLSLETEDLPSPHIDISTVTVQLPDGTVVEPEASTRGTDGPFSRTAWFQLPVEVREATAVVAVDVQLGITRYEVDTVEVPLEFTSDDGGEA